MICFKCGHLGHKEDVCPLFTSSKEDEDRGHAGGKSLASRKQPPSDVVQQDSAEKYGQWMLVSRRPRKGSIKAKVDQGQKSPPKTGMEHSPPKTGMEQAITSGTKGHQVNPLPVAKVQGMRFDIIGSSDGVAMEVDSSDLTKNVTVV